MRNERTEDKTEKERKERMKKFGTGRIEVEQKSMKSMFAECVCEYNCVCMCV